MSFFCAERTLYPRSEGLSGLAPASVGAIPTSPGRRAPHLPQKIIFFGESPRIQRSWAFFFRFENYDI